MDLEDFTAKKIEFSLMIEKLVDFSVIFHTNLIYVKL